MRSAAEIIKTAEILRSRYSERDSRYEVAWLAYNGDYEQIIGANYPSTDMRDIRHHNAQSFQIWNYIKPIVDTHRLLINKLPGIRVPAVEYGRPEEAGKAERLEKLLYAIWDASQMSRRHGEAAFDIALMYSTVWMTRWDRELEHPVIVGRNPRECYPIMKRHGDEVAACFFIWEEYIDELVEQVPEAESLLSGAQARSSQKVQAIEYIDDKDYVLVINGKSKNMVPWSGSHKLGKVPVDITSGAHIRGEVFPPGPVDQLIAANDHLNRFQTKWGDALEGALFGHWHVDGPGAAEYVLNSTPGGLSRNTDPDTKLSYVQPQAPPREVFAQLKEIQDFMRVHANWPASASGEMEGSIITGRAVSRLQGVMASMAAEADDNLGRSLSRCNGWALEMMEKYRPSKKFVLFSGSPVSAMSSPGRPQAFKVEVIPERDIQGYYQNELTYSPFGSDMNAAMTIGMQAVQADIFSRRYLRNLWPGIADAEGMAREIDEEKESRMRLELKLQAEAQKAAAEIQMQQQMAMMQAQQGMAPPGPGGPTEAAPPGAEGAPPGPPPQGAPPEGMPLPPDMAPGGGSGPVVLPEGRPFVMGMGEPLSGAENFPLPTENVLPYNQALEQLAPRGEKPGMAGEMGPGAISAEEVTEALQGVQKLKGQVYLMGQLAERGATMSIIELGITNKLDKQTILNALPQYQGKIRFTVLPDGAAPPGAVPVVGAPAEQPEEVTV
jgi:hypothetical protein